MHISKFLVGLSLVFDSLCFLGTSAYFQSQQKDTSFYFPSYVDGGSRLRVNQDKRIAYVYSMTREEYLKQIDSLARTSIIEEAFVLIPSKNLVVELGYNESLKHFIRELSYTDTTIFQRRIQSTHAHSLLHHAYIAWKHNVSFSETIYDHFHPKHMQLISRLPLSPDTLPLQLNRPYSTSKGQSYSSTSLSIEGVQVIPKTLPSDADIATYVDYVHLFGTNSPQFRVSTAGEYLDVVLDSAFVETTLSSRTWLDLLPFSNNKYSYGYAKPDSLGNRSYTYTLHEIIRDEQ